jgi:hypothetical protein
MVMSDKVHALTLRLAGLPFQYQFSAGNLGRLIRTHVRRVPSAAHAALHGVLLGL